MHNTTTGPATNGLGQPFTIAGNTYVPAPATPRPCPSCGHCPTCGHGRQAYPYWYSPIYPQYTWTVASDTYAGGIGAASAQPGYFAST